MTSRPPTLPVPPFSRSPSMSQSSYHGNLDTSQEHPTIAPQEPLLSSANIPSQSSSSTIPKIRTTTAVGEKKHKGRSSNILERLETTWYIEAFFLTCSAVCAVLIVALLAAHNHHRTDSWHYYFSINTVASALGTVFKSTLLMAVSAALAQGKWTWFRKRPGTLSTFESINAGSHDTVESFRLLWRMKGQHLVSAGAPVIALGFMVEPFLQAVISDYGQLVDIDPSNTDSTSATIGSSRRFDGGTQCISTYKTRYPKIDTTPDFAISASLYDGLNVAGSHGYQNVSFTCLFGNCTWPEYVSIAVRSTCFDISDHLKRTNPEDPGQTKTTTTGKPSRASSSSAADSTETSESDPDTEMAMYPTAAPLTTALTAFGDTSPLDSLVAPIRSTVTRATTGLAKRASSSVQSPSATPSQSSAMWTDWTLEHLDLTLTNTNEQWRNANTFAVLQAAVVADPNLTINFKDSQTLLAAFTIIRADDGHTPGSADWDAAAASAIECGLELVLNVYNSSVVNNILSEQVVANVSKKLPESWLPSSSVNQTMYHPYGLKADPGTNDSNPIYHDTFLLRDDYALDPAGLERGDVGSFNITQKTLLSTVDFLTSLIRQDNDNATVKAIQDNQTTLYTYGSPILQPLFDQTNTTATFDAVAKSMSNAIRNLGTEPVSGTAKQWVRFYQVRWAFLTLPLSLITIGTIFFILSIIEAHKAHVPNWKANSIATMIHGPDEALQRHLRTQNHAHSLNVASETIAKLEWFPEGYALTAVDHPAPKISRPTTPVRDEEEHDMNALRPSTTPQTPGSNVTLVDPQSVGGAVQGDNRSVSPIGTGPGWSDVQINTSSTPTVIPRSL